MKALELTKKHNSKLLEMCKVLFPEYNIIEFGKKYYPFTDYIWLFKNNNLEVEIHWFEFCMTHLLEKILNPKDLNNEKIKERFISFFMEMSSYSWFTQDPGIRESFADHPVDYLYKEFKKLKIK